MLNYFCKQDLFINSNKVTVEMFLKTKNLCLSLTLFDFSEFQVIFSIPYQGKFCREKVTKFWLRDEDFPRRNFYRPNFFARWIFLPNEYHQRIKISRGNWRVFLFFFFPIIFHLTLEWLQCCQYQWKNKKKVVAGRNLDVNDDD